MKPDVQSQFLFTVDLIIVRDDQSIRLYGSIQIRSKPPNHQTSFAAKTEIIYFRFEFDEFPVSAPYSRVWYKDGKEWVRYNCYWPGPESGVEEITLTDPLGLPSGTWNVVITINGVQVANENLTVEGSWNQWSPPGYFNSCYGKR